MSFIQVERTDPELLAVMPEVGEFTAFHRSSEGTNCYERGDNKDGLVSKVTNLAGLSWNEVKDMT